MKTVGLYEAVKFYGDEIWAQHKKGQYKLLIVIGFGKASCPMAKTLEEDLADLFYTEYVITKYDHCPNNFKVVKIRVREVVHSVLDETGLKEKELCHVILEIHTISNIAWVSICRVKSSFLRILE